MQSLRFLSFRNAFAASCGLIGCVLWMSAAQAATITVDSSSDAVNPGGACTLRGAVAAINGAFNANGCINSTADIYGTNDTILFSPALAGSTITFASQIQIQKNLFIDGNVNGATAITLNGNNVTRLLYASGGTALTISHLIFRNGNAGGGNGGAIYADVAGLTLTVQDSSFDNNQAVWGGAVGYMDTLGHINVARSTFTNNSAAVRNGGALWGYWTTVNASTFSNNSANGYGGAISVNVVTANNSTFVGNTAGQGGAIAAFYDTPVALTARELTLVNNITLYGSAIYLNGKTGNLNNSLIAGDASVTSAQCSTGTFSGGANIEWRNGSNENSCNSSTPVPVPGGFTLAQIVATVLTNNGGPTPTLALPAGSPAIDTADPATASATDQRGFFRPVGNAPDLGAFEYASTSPLPPQPQLQPQPVVVYPKTQAFVTTTTDSGRGIDLSRITGLIAPNPGDIGQQGAYFVLAHLPATVAVAPDSYWYLDSALNWHLFADCRITPAYFTGDLQILRGLPIIPTPSDLFLFKGTELYFGYGLGGYAAPSGTACNDMLARQNFIKVYTVQ